MNEGKEGRTVGFRRAAGLVALIALPAAMALAFDTGMGDPVEGQHLFASKGCLYCHAVRGEGGRTGPDLGRKAVRGSFYEIAAALWNHSPGMGRKMREFRLNRPSFSGSQVADLIGFLYFLNYFDEPGDPRVGKTLFTEKHCTMCHRVGGEGGETGPRLDIYPRGVSPLRIAQDFWNHGPAMAEALQGEGLDVPKFRGKEILDLFAFLRNQGQREASREFQAAGDPDRGKELFDAKGCSRCHAMFGVGGQLAPDLGRAELHGSVTQLAGRMWNHWGEMGEAMESMGLSRPRFEGDDLADLFAYIFLARYDGLPGDARRGATAYEEKGCPRCHGLGGGGLSAPPLRDITGGEDKEEIVQRMWNHVPEMLTKMGSRRIPWPRIGADEMADLLTFLSEGWEGEATPSQPDE